MKLFSRIALSLLLLTPYAKGQGGAFSFDGKGAILIEPGDATIEHAFNDYHHYYPKSSEVKMFELYASPFYKHWSFSDDKKGERTVNTFGSFLQGQFNCGDFWVRLNTIVGKAQEKLKEIEVKKEEGEAQEKTSVTKTEHEDFSKVGVDDVLIKAGYDFFVDGDDHIGVYLVGGIATNRDLPSNLSLNDVLEIKTPQLGTKHYRLGVGINGGWTLYACDEQHAAWLFDAQYRYAFPATYVNFKEAMEAKDVNNEHIKKLDKHDVRFTPGHTVTAWSALHYGFDAWQFELGSSFIGTFGKHVHLENVHTEEKSKEGSEEHKTTETTHPLDGKIIAPDTVKFGVTPYVGVSYNTLIGDNPLTIGFGVGYDFNRLHERNKEEKANSFHGFKTWFTVALNF